MLVFLEQYRDIAFRVFHITEMERVGNAGIDTGGRCLGIDSRSQAVFETEVDPVRAESTLLSHSQAGRSVALGLVLHALAIGEGRLSDFVAGLKGTGHHAIGAADAQLVVDRDDSIGTLTRRCTWAHVHARRVDTVHTTYRNESTAHVGVGTDLNIEHLAPLHGR